MTFHRSLSRSRRGAALLIALFVMTLVSTLAVGMMDAEMTRYSALRNTRQWDEARYLAEAGLNDALAHLETDITWRDGFENVEFPIGSGSHYRVEVLDGLGGKVKVVAVGQSGDFSRRLEVTLKQGG